MVKWNGDVQLFNLVSMTKSALIQFLLLIVFFTSANAQKVKYKDIFGLLNTKQYEAAEPFLKKYLIENDDNPNAFLYMGIIYQEKSLKEDVLRKTQRTISLMDSSILYLDKAYKTITEKEVKKNDEYYQIYNRRDLRTGEFGVKLSDIQYDLEKRMEGQRERIDRVKMVKHYFVQADSLYRGTQRLYVQLQQAYPGEKEFYLRADENTLNQLKRIESRYDSCRKAFENYKGSLPTVGKTGYNQAMILADIKNLKTDGATPADFYKDEIQAWDFKKFAEGARQIIEKEIFPMRDHLVEYDIEINKLREKLKTDSVSVKNDLTALIDKLLLEKLLRFDKDPLPMDVFQVKMADLTYRSTVIENKKSKDSTNVQVLVNQVKLEQQNLSRLDSLAEKLMASDLDKRAEDYQHFITNTYSNTIVLKSYIKALAEFADREKRQLDEKMKIREESLRWLLNTPDSVPLYAAEGNAYKPLFVENEKYTVGLHFKDSVTAAGYFFTITPTRVPDVKITFEVDKPNFKLAQLPMAKALVYADPSGQVFYVLVYSGKATKDNKYGASLAKIYRSDGLAWNMNYSLSFVPNSISFKQETGELTIQNEAIFTIVDKNGKVLK